MHSILNSHKVDKTNVSNDSCRPTDFLVAPHKLAFHDTRANRSIDVKHSQPILPIGVAFVTLPLEHGDVIWAHVHGRIFRCPSCAPLRPKPHTVIFACNGMIMQDAIVTRHNPAHLFFITQSLSVAERQQPQMLNPPIDKHRGGFVTHQKHAGVWSVLRRLLDAIVKTHKFPLSVFCSSTPSSIKKA